MGLRRPTTDTLHQVVERQHPRDAQGLMAQLRGGSTDERRWAARDMANLPETVGALAQRLNEEREPRVREAIFTALASIGGAAAVDAVLPLLRSDEAPLRNGAIEVLGRLADETATRVDALLKDPDADVRIFAVNLLCELQHPRVVTWLLQVLREEREVNVVAAAIEVLTEVGEPAHAVPLREATQRFADDPFISFAADIAAMRIEAL